MDNNDDFQAAFLSEMGVEAETENTTATDTTESTDTNDTSDTTDSKDNDKDNDGDNDATDTTDSTDDDATNDADGGTEDDKSETAEEKANREETEAAGAAEEVKPLSKEDILAALNERDSALSNRVDKVKEAADEVIEKLYPQGIDKNIYDTDGNVIKTAQDIVDRALVNPNTNEPFTYEQAASFMLEAGRQMTENIEQLREYATEIAEKNVNLLEGNNQVIAKWGDTLKALPKETVDMLADTYMKTQLKFDKTNSYITEMAMSPEDFYNIALSPYSKLNEAIAKNAELETAAQAAAAAEQQREAEAEQAERTGGIPPQRGTSATKPNTGNEFTDALVEELMKG